MDVQAILQAVNTVGFPIVICLLSFWFIYKMQMQYRDDIIKLQEQHNKESAEMRTALNNNTVVMQQLTDKIEFKLIAEEAEED